ncbi:ATP-binding protein [Rhodoferax ferrireducens]|uniref:ATP-binding protein n=1 Tax=Rhodoferax ferrireducens TaxID=192843 RepID=UPI000E0D8CA5|nr:ATP-binding protein [Rhodoferax ferrireducens]
MQFEDFGSNRQTSPARPTAELTPQDAPQAPSPASTNERFLTLCTAVEAAIQGDFNAPLPLQGNDRLTRLTRQLQQLFGQLQDTSAATTTALPAAGSTGGAAQPELHRENARLKYLIANTPAIIYSSVPTGDGTMTFVSDNALRVLDYRPEEMVADPSFWFDHIHPDDVPTIFSSFALIFTEGQQAYEYRFRARDGRYLWMHDTLRLIRDADGNPLEVVGSLTDITDRKLMEAALQKKGEEQQQLINQLQEAQAQLLQSEKMASIGQLAAGIAHEINNPIGFVNSNMGALKGYVDTLCELTDSFNQSVQGRSGQEELKAEIAQLRKQADYEFLKDDAADLVKESLDGLKRVKDIVQSLKDFAHIGETDWQLADLHAGIDSTLTIAANEFKYKATLQKAYGTMPQVKCLASQLNQVFMNLIVNAAHAIQDKGVITIRTGSENDWVWVEIGDNGCGMPPEIMNRIFEPFFTTKPVGKGTGLGLSLSYNIVAKHGGRIEVASELGTGTRFTVHLPVNQIVATSAAA